MGKPTEKVALDDDDVQEELHRLAERSGRPRDVLANAIERGLGDVEAGRVRSTDEVLAYLQEQRRLRNRG